jgi:WD40 repeat protein
MESENRNREPLTPLRDRLMHNSQLVQPENGCNWQQGCSKTRLMEDERKKMSPEQNKDRLCPKYLRKSTFEINFEAQVTSAYDHNLRSLFKKKNGKVWNTGPGMDIEKTGGANRGEKLKNVSLDDLELSKYSAYFSPQCNYPQTIDWNGSHKRLLFLSGDQLFSWEDQAKKLRPAGEVEDNICSVKWMRSSTMVLLGDSKGGVTFRDFEREKNFKYLETRYGQPVVCLETSGYDNEAVFLHSVGSEIHLVDLRGGKHIEGLLLGRFLNSNINSVVSVDEQIVASLSEDGAMRMWDRRMPNTSLKYAVENVRCFEGAPALPGVFAFCTGSRLVVFSERLAKTICEAETNSDIGGIFWSSSNIIVTIHERRLVGLQLWAFKCSELVLLKDLRRDFGSQYCQVFACRGSQLTDHLCLLSNCLYLPDESEDSHLVSSIIAIPNHFINY